MERIRHGGRPDLYAGNYDNQVPMFLVTDGIESAVRQPKSAAGKKAVTIIGSASSTRECILAGLADEPHLDIPPILLHAGFRSSDILENKSIHLERINTVEMPAGTIHVYYRVTR